jgi:APA family basic amino acid/polyamine antiporter
MGSTADQSGFKRSLKLLHATALVVGTIIGASIFVQPSEITAHVPDITGVLVAWGAAGLLTLFGALACAELASAFPKTGGVYVFLNETYSPVWGFLWGWAMFWVMHSGIIAAIAVVFARYTEFFVPVGPGGIPLLAIGAIVLLSAINYVGVRHGSVLQTAFTVGKVVAIAIIVVLAFWLGADRPQHFVYSAGGAAAAPPAGAGDFVLALIAGLFAFGGWHMVTYTAEETVDPERTIPKALIAGTLAVTACYVLLNAAYLYVLPLDEVAKSTRVAADAADVLVGTGGAGAVSALVMFSTFGGIAGIILAGPRVYYAMARDGLLFSWFAAIHPRYRTPHRAIVLQAVWASALVWTGTYRQLFTRVIFTEWIFFGLMTAGIFLLRRRPGYRPAYRIWGYPLVPAVFVLSSALIVAQRIRAEPLESVIGLAIVGLGVPVYYLWARKGGPAGPGV